MTAYSSLQLPPLTSFLDSKPTMRLPSIHELTDTIPITRKNSIASLLNPDSMEKHVGGRKKGLRHFSKLVSDKVEELGVTTYNEVADKLAAALVHSDQKNIRRRVYDALNVLMAMGIITKDRKQIRWLGIPTSDHQNAAELEHQVREQEREYAQLTESVQHMRAEIQSKIDKYLRIQQLVWYNASCRSDHDDSSSTNKVDLPFFVAGCCQECCEIETPSDRTAIISAQGSATIHLDTDVIGALQPDLSPQQAAAWLPNPEWYQLYLDQQQCRSDITVA